MEYHSMPNFCGAYNEPYGLREKVERESERLLENWIFEPACCTPESKSLYTTLHGL